MNQRVLTLLTIAAVTTLAACGGEKAKPEAGGENAPGVVSPEEFRKQQAHYADSVINATKSAKDVVTRLGKDYAVGSTRLRDSLALLTDKSDCYGQGRKIDPYLAGTISYFVFMSVVGSNVVRVQEAQWTSAAGNIVVACLNLAAKDWKFDSTFGKPAAYITQVLVKPDTGKIAATAGKAATAAKPDSVKPKKP